MPTTLRVPVDVRNPRVATLAGNAFYSALALTAWDAGHWEFVKDVDGKLYGLVPVPKNVHSTPNAKLVGIFGWNATTGVARLSAGTKAVADDGESMNPGSFTGETAQDITVPGTAYLTKRVTIPSAGSLGEAVVADDLLIIELFHEGAHANDTVAVNTLLWSLFLQVDVL
jgi:hypothetical protein